MTFWQGIFLGIVQGITEFLPVSSDGHLTLFQHLFGMKEHHLFFDLCLHMGTLLALFVYFRKELYNLTIDVLAGTLELCQGHSWGDVTFKNPQLKFFILICIATIPTGLMGVYGNDFFKNLFSSLIATGLGFWITTLLVWSTQFSKEGTKTLDQMNVFHALVIGIFQGFSIAPGLSRSGSTISMALFLGIERPLAARFSFIMSIPAILGATLLEFRHAMNGGEAMPPVLTVVCGTAAAAIVGYFAIRFLVQVLSHGNFHRFSYYTLFIGAVTLFTSLFIK